MDHRYFDPRPTNSGAHRRQALGLAVAVLLAGWMALNFLKDKGGLTPSYAVVRTAPEFIGHPADWINTGGKALHLYSPDAKRDVVYLVDFRDYTSNPRLNTLPYLKAWDQKYRKEGLVIVGIHTPGVGFARDARNVRAAVERLGISYPVLVDSASQNGKAYANTSRPHEYLIDGSGHIIHEQEGEGRSQETEEAIRAALQQIHPGLTRAMTRQSPADAFGLDDFAIEACTEPA